MSSAICFKLDQSKILSSGNGLKTKKQKKRKRKKNGWVENIVGKGENAGYQHFLLFPQCFQKLSFQEGLKVGIVR